MTKNLSRAAYTYTLNDFQLFHALGNNSKGLPNFPDPNALGLAFPDALHAAIRVQSLLQGCITAATVLESWLGLGPQSLHAAYLVIDKCNRNILHITVFF